jgi:hypothetical protein
MTPIRKPLATIIRLFTLGGLFAIGLTLLFGPGADSNVTQGPGDNRTGYEAADYESRSVS